MHGGFKGAAEARRSLGELAGLVPPDVFENAVFLVNELVTNAIRHGMIGAAGEIDISVDATPERLRVEVINAGRGALVQQRTPDMGEGSGWGLHLVESLSNRWGSSDDGRTLVWFEIDLP